MKLNSISISNFKKIDNITIDLGKVNYLVGGNNSGKSSVLQAIHMAASCAKQSSEIKAQIIPESQLRYSPTSAFIYLGHHAPYENNANGSRCKVEFLGVTEDDVPAAFNIQIYKGRNYGNVGVDRNGLYPGFGSIIVDHQRLFSIYVPGLSGIPHNEEYKNYAAVFHKAAGGDANLVFRNIIRLLHENGKLNEVEELVSELTSPCKIEVNHDPNKDLYLDINIIQENDKRIPIDLVGTGVLQILQILSYVALFRPALLLIDEPDNHLHPSRQALLSQAFTKISDKYSSTIIVSTHSRHMIAKASEDAKIIWMKDGNVESSECKDLAAILMDIGALDQLDSTGAECIICTEDKGKQALLKSIEHLNLSDRVKVISYNGITNAASAVAIKAMASLFENEPAIVIHRDRDFLTDEEVSLWGEEYSNRGMTIFSPPLCDIEAYHCTAAHLMSVFEVSEEEANGILAHIFEMKEEDFRVKFRQKRREANAKFWKDGGSPNTDELWPMAEPTTLERSYGKGLLSAINEHRQNNRAPKRNLLGIHSGPLSSLLQDHLASRGIR